MSYDVKFFETPCILKEITKKLKITTKNCEIHWRSENAIKNITSSIRTFAINKLQTVTIALESKSFRIEREKRKSFKTRHLSTTS